MDILYSYKEAAKVSRARTRCVFWLLQIFNLKKKKKPFETKKKNVSLKLKIPQVEPYQYIRIHPFQSFGSATTQHQEGPRIHQNVDLSKIFGPSSEDFGGWDGIQKNP